MAMYQHTYCEECGVIHRGELNYNPMENQDHKDHKRDIEIFDCEDANKYNRHLSANMRLKASYGMNAMEYEETWGNSFMDDIHQLKYQDHN